MSPTTIATYVTALSYVNKILGAQDLTSSFIVKKLMAGLQRQGQAPDVRLPITIDILHKLVHAVRMIMPSCYQKCLYGSMFLLAFAAFLRIGEICPKTAKERNKVVQLDDCTFSESRDSVTVLIRNCKGNTSKTPFRITIQSNNSGAYCPVKALIDFIALRGLTPGPLFVFGALPVTRQVFCSVLRDCISWIGLDHKLYKAHSFRLGAASSAAMQGVSNSDIQRMGRWKSDAFRRYIRIPALKSTVH